MYFDLRLWALTRGLRGRILGAVLIGLVGLPVGLGRLALAGVVIAGVIQGRAFAELAPLLAVIGLLVVARSLVQLSKEEVANRIAAEVKVRLRNRIYRHVLALGPGPFDQQRTGGVLLSLVEGVEQLETFFGLYLPQLIVAALTPVVVFGFMALLDLPTAFVFLAFALFALIVPSLFHRWNASSSLRRRKAYAELGAEFLDAIQGLATLKAFGQSRARGALLAMKARHLFRATMGILAANSATGGVTLLGISAGAAVALGLGAIRVSQGEMQLATLVVVLTLGVEVFRPLRELTAIYHRGMMAISAADGIFAILDAEPEVRDPGRGAGEPGSWGEDERGSEGARARESGRAAAPQPPRPPAPRPEATEIELQQVTFAYPGRPNALEDVSFTLRAGETLGLVGPSGAGKSTVVWLLLRFFDPQRGRILLGGRDLREIPLDELRAQVAVVTQDTYLFHGTVAENLLFGKPDATRAEVEAAARAANAHEFIAALPQGYDTVVGERGMRLSGGQRQRIAIARALLKDAPILLLDEALSSVDTENETLIQEALDRLQRGRTTLVIAHRLSSVIGADRILVLDRGRLVEQGRHAELLAINGVYARLMARQAAERDARPAHSRDSGEGEPRFPLPLGEGGGEGEAAPLAGRGDGRGTSAFEGAPDGRALTLTLSQREREPELDHDPARNDGGPSDSSAAGSRPLPTPVVWRRLLLLVRPWWGKLALTFILGLGRVGSLVGLAVVSALTVGRVARGEPFEELLVWLGLLVPASAALTWLESWVAHDFAFRLLAEMRIDLYRVLDPLAPAYFTRRRSGDLTSVVTGDVELVEYFFAHTIGPFFVAVIVPGMVLVGLGLLGWPLALALLPFLLVVGVSPFVAQRAAEGISERARRELGDLNARIVDSIQGLRTVVAFGQGEAQLRRVEQASRSYNVHQLAFLRNQALHNASIEAASGFGALAVLAVGAWLVTAGAMPPTLLALAVVTAQASFIPVHELAKTVKELAGTVAAARRIFEIHDEPVPVVDGPGVAAEPPREGEKGGWGEGEKGRSGAGGLSPHPPFSPSPLPSPPNPPGLGFERVTFHYAPGLTPALRGLEFSIEPGRTVALVGRSGAGKTTAAHLVLRFWDPQEGRIVLGGHDLREYKLDDLRRQVALVAQDTYLFNTSLRENLMIGRPDASQAELDEAVRRANLADVIAELPRGYDTPVGERGFQLSGGQRQRVAIARALLKDAPVLILDEATSHLDAESERLVHRALDELMRGRTTLVIAHRLSTVRNADRIVVLESGSVVEQGTHDELLAHGGLYAQLVAAQLAGARSNGRTAAAESFVQPSPGM